MLLVAIFSHAPLSVPTTRTCEHRQLPEHLIHAMEHFIHGIEHLTANILRPLRGNNPGVRRRSWFATATGRGEWPPDRAPGPQAPDIVPGTRRPPDIIPPVSRMSSTGRLDSPADAHDPVLPPA